MIRKKSLQPLFEFDNRPSVSFCWQVNEIEHLLAVDHAYLIFKKRSVSVGYENDTLCFS